MQTRCAAEFPSLSSLARRAALASLAGLVFAPAVFEQSNHERVAQLVRALAYWITAEV